MLVMHSSQIKQDQRSFKRVRVGERERERERVKREALNSLGGSAPKRGLHDSGNIENAIGGRRLLME
jgi:hypothetical protein